MMTRHEKPVLGAVLLVLGVGCLLAQLVACPHENQQLNLDAIPKKVMDTLKAKFPKAKIEKWTKEKESGVFVYDIEFKQDGLKFEVDIAADGTIHNWEKAIAAKDLPEIVRRAAEKKYPRSTLKEVMIIMAVKQGKDFLEGYEITLETVNKRLVELTVAPDGKILEAHGK